MKRLALIFLTLIVTLVAVAISVRNKETTEVKTPMFTLISVVPFDIKPNKAILADDNLILYGKSGAYITSYDNPTVNEETKFIDGDITEVFYEDKSKILFVSENKKHIHIYNLSGDALIPVDKIPMNDSFGEIGFVADDLGNVYIAEAYKVSKYSIDNGTWKILKTWSSGSYSDVDGAIQAIDVIDDNIVIGQSYHRGGETSSILNEENGEITQIKVEEKDRYMGPTHHKNGRYFLLGGLCQCEIKLTNDNIEFVRYFKRLITNYFKNTLIVGNTLVGFYDDNSYELFDINSPLKEVPPFATGTLTFIPGEYESIRYAFSTNDGNELILITIDNTAIGSIYKVRPDL